MIKHLQVNNVGLIEKIELSLHKGLNIFSGETGAGKSMVIDAIHFVFGERPGKDFVRTEADCAYVEVLIDIQSPMIAEAIHRLGDSILSDQTLLLSRSLTRQGRSVCRANGKVITVKILKAIAALLVDVHGQHQHQSLLYPARHIILLDRFCGETLEKHKLALAEGISCYKDILKQIAMIADNEKDASARVQLLTFQKNEIETAQLQKDEEKQLWKQRNKLVYAQQLIENVRKSLGLLYTGNQQMSAAEQIARAIHFIQDIVSMDPSKTELLEQIEALNFQLEEINRELTHYVDTLEDDPEALNKIEDRIDLIESLKHKYSCKSVNEILQYYHKIAEQFDFIQNSSNRLAQLLEKKKKYSIEILRICKQMSNIRKTAADTIVCSITTALKDLGMEHAQFQIDIQQKKEFGLNGYDKVEFLISPNPGETLKPLAKIASGGEMSRVMLALKSVLANVDNISTFIFDEIDTGVSGRTAQQVAEKLLLLSRTHQLICITHLPQIAAVGDANFLIEKQSEAHRTATQIYSLDNEMCIQELARLIGGAKITDTTLIAAKEMKEMAKTLLTERMGRAIPPLP